MTERYGGNCLFLLSKLGLTAKNTLISPNFHTMKLGGNFAVIDVKNIVDFMNNGDEFTYTGVTETEP